MATAGHVDHGKSALILRLTGMDPDRLAEEKRRGLTIDLGFAWTILPSGREIGFVDVPGHERFVRNMLAGVGPVRLVLFVVAADEGWKPQSEEHLEIVDVLGAEGAVIAVTKSDLVDEETLGIAVEEVRDRLEGTVLESSPIVSCSASTGAGLDDLTTALDTMVGAAPAPDQHGRPRQFVDRVFTIRGAGTVVTGTLTGGRVRVGQEIELYPAGARARVRGLQTHKHAIEVARPVSRVAANLVGAEREDLTRGDVLGLPGQWRPTRVLEARIRPVRSIDHALTPRGAYKLYVGSAERDARLRFYGSPQLTRPDGVFVRVRLSSPVVVAPGDRFVLREAGRRRTVAGGVVLDPEPPTRPGPDPQGRLRARETADPAALPGLLVRERGAIRATDVIVLTGMPPSASQAVRVGAWWLSPALHGGAENALVRMLERFHAEHPLLEGAELAAARGAVAAVLEQAGVRADPGLIDSMIDELAARGRVARDGSSVRLATHRVSLAGREEELEGLVSAVATGEPKPPTVTELVSKGFSREVIDAAVRGGALVRISPDLVMTPGFVTKAESILRQLDPSGITVSDVRERLGTSRKFALPLLEHFDRMGVTVRRGEVRALRNRA